MTFKGHGHPKLTVSSSRYKFSKITNLAMVSFFDIFRSYLEELLLIKLSLTLDNFIAKYQKVCEISWAKLGMKWKTRKVGYLCRLVGYPWLQWKFVLKNFFTYSLWYDKFAIQNSWMVLSVSIEKKFVKVWAKTTNFV